MTPWRRYPRVLGLRLDLAGGRTARAAPPAAAEWLAGSPPQHGTTPRHRGRKQREQAIKLTFRVDEAGKRKAKRLAGRAVLARATRATRAQGARPFG